MPTVSMPLSFPAMHAGHLLVIPTWGDGGVLLVRGADSAAEHLLHRDAGSGVGAEGRGSQAT